MELQRAQRYCRLEPMWEKDKEKVKRVISLTQHYSTGVHTLASVAIAIFLQLVESSVIDHISHLLN